MSERKYRLVWSRSEPGRETLTARYVDASELWVEFSDVVNDESNTLISVERVTW